MLPARMKELRAEHGPAHVAECWRRGVVQCEPGWFFAREGVLFEIDFMGGNVVTNPIPIPGAPANLEWFGAGSTTSAPPVAG